MNARAIRVAPDAAALMRLAAEELASRAQAAVAYRPNWPSVAATSARLFADTGTPSRWGPSLSRVGRNHGAGAAIAARGEACP